MLDIVFVAWGVLVVCLAALAVGVDLHCISGDEDEEI